MLESTVERHLREEAKKRKGMALKFVSPGMNGKQSNGSCSHSVVAESIKERQENRQICERKFRHTNKSSKE